MVGKWGTDIEAKLDSRSAVRYLMQCEGIGKTRAENIKAAWDATKGGRLGWAPARGRKIVQRPLFWAAYAQGGARSRAAGGALAGPHTPAPCLPSLGAPSVSAARTVAAAACWLAHLAAASHALQARARV